MKRDLSFEKAPRCFAFTGNGDTNVDAVVEMLARIYADIGLLPENKVFGVRAEELLSEYIGQGSVNAKKAVDQARGGVLLVKNVDVIPDGPLSDDVLDALLVESDRSEGDLVLVLEGSADGMAVLLERAPGLQHRIGDNLLALATSDQSAVRKAKGEADDKHDKYAMLEQELPALHADKSAEKCCPRCGFKLDASARFCSFCGKKI